jgi:hypothetical protein
MIKLTEYLMGRDTEYPLTLELALNAAEHLAAINYIRGVYGAPLPVTSGYRPGKYNKKAGGAAKSSHLLCEATDFGDKPLTTVEPSDAYFGKFCINGEGFELGKFGRWCLVNLKTLEEAGLYMEHPAKTPGWVHLTTRAPASGNRVFLP